MTTTHSRDWIVLADSAHVKIFMRDYVNGAMKQVIAYEHPEARLRQRDLASDRPGSAGVGSAHHNYDDSDRPDFPERESQVFLQAVSEQINQAAADNAMDNLILVALPKTAATLKASFRSEASRKLKAEYAKNLISEPEQKLVHHLDQLKEKASKLA